MKKVLKWTGGIIGGIVALMLIVAAVAMVRYNRFGLYPSGGVLSENQAAFDVSFYDIHLRIDPAEKSISGYTQVKLQAVKNGLSEIHLQLIDNFEVTKVTNATTELAFEHSDDLLNIKLPQPLAENDFSSYKIYYAGKPVEAMRPPWVGGFNWSKDAAGNHWVGLSCQGEGAKIWFPCKDHPSDEPDSAGINITVPTPYFCAANGLLENVTESGDSLKTYHWKTRYSINNYNINISIGMYEKVQKMYTTESGDEMPVVFYYLPEAKDGAEKLVDFAIENLQTYRTFFGEYPFSKEKFGLVQTDYLGMEHQTINAYGNDYRFSKVHGTEVEFDWLMLHEMGHEWWGNKITVKDWADFWIQEGICSYAEALHKLEIGGEPAYHNHMATVRSKISNKNPIIPKRNATTTEAYSGDIYSKGAFMMHTMRFVLGDSVFFPTVKEFATDPQFTYQNLVSTDDFIALVNKNSGNDWRPLLEYYLTTTNVPDVQVDSVGINQWEIAIRDIMFTMPMDVQLGDKVKRFDLGKEAIEVNCEQRPVVDPQGWFLKRGDVRG